MKQMLLITIIGIVSILEFCTAQVQQPSTTPSPTSRPTSITETEDYCVDLPGWKDSDGDGCLVYAANKNCDTYSECCENNAHVANTACCVCGGGFISGGIIPSMRPSVSPTRSMTPSNMPTDVPSDSPVTPSGKPTTTPTATHKPTLSVPTVMVSSRGFLLVNCASCITTIGVGVGVLLMVFSI